MQADVHVSLFNSCENYTDVANLAHGVSGLVCLIFILPTLALQLYYCCCYKSTFLLRLFFYLTIACVFMDVCLALLLVLYSHPDNTALCQVLGGFEGYSLVVELLLIFSIDMILLYMVCKYSFGRCAMKLCTSRTSRICEFLFVGLHFMFPLAVTIIRSTIFWHNNPEYCWQTREPQCIYKNLEFTVESTVFVYLPVGMDLLLSPVVIVVLVGWFCTLKRKKLMANRYKIVFKETSLFVGFLVTFVSFWLLSMAVAFVPNTPLHIASAALFPVSNTVLLLSFLVYMCVSIHQDVEERRIANDGLVTMPPSSRVSLPTDTAEHAPNFLSPSTAEPSEVTPLLTVNLDD